MSAKKNKFKRIVAGVLSALAIVGTVPCSAFAADGTANIVFSYVYQSNGSQVMFQDSFVGTHGSDGGAGKPATQIYANGEEAYCIEPGASLHTGDTLTANASDTWNNLGSAKKNAVKMALAFGKPGNAGALGGSGDAKHLATQMLVWEFVTGYRDAVSYDRTNSSIFNAYCKNGANSEVAANYNAIVSAMKNWNVKPGFANGSTYKMKWQDGKYILSITDPNGVLSGYSVSSSDSNVKISKSGNTITLISDQYIAKDPTITLTKSSNISASAVLVPYGSPTLQDVVTGVAKAADVTADFKVSTPGGTLKLKKTSEDGIVSGVKMTIKGEGFIKTVTTGENGEVSVEGLIPGSYTVTEAVASCYEPQAEQTVTITSGETATVKFANVLKRGDLSVAKTSEDGFAEGMKFRLYGISASGTNVDLYATTDKNGVATFKNVLIAGVSGYTLEEVDTAIRYVIPENQNVTVAWKETTGASVNNILKKFNVTIVKKDAEVQTPQGDAALVGAVYGIYHDGELIDTYTTDKNGSFTTDYYVCGNTWTIREITPSEGYLLDEKEYHVGADPENYTVELNSAPSLTSHEQVIKGNVAIIKHSDDGSTQIETPEEGAAFQIYLTAAGSFENAKESERDTLVCDADGFAQSKDLPYGIYTVHQTEGWEETEFMRDFTVFIRENGRTYKYLINNAPYSAYIKVVKADKETGRTIPLTGAGFEIYNASGEKISMSYTYPTLTTVDTFYVSEDGYLITPQKLEIGEYSLVEVQAPYGYVLDSTPVPFTVTSKNNEDLEGLTVISVTAYDQAQKGTISITKSGEIFASVNVAGEEGVLDKEGSWGVIDPVYSAVYEEKALSGAAYQVIAAEDIVTGDGTVRAEAGEMVAEITTDEDGFAKTGELYLGKYKIVEIQAPDGFVLNTEAQEVELIYAGQEISVTSTSTSFINDRQKLEMSAKKAMEQDELYQIGMNGEITAVSFGLYAREELIAADGSKIPADGLMEITFADEEGNVRFRSDLPFGSYYVKELTTDIHYVLSDTIYEVNFRYAGQETALQTVVLNKGNGIENELKYGHVEGLKVNDEVADGEEKGMAGAVFGIFREGTMELTAEHAIATAASDENGEFVFEKVPYGDYLVAELEAPEGYVLSDARHFLSVTFDKQVIGLKAINYPIIGSVELTKVDKDYPDNHLAGAVFEVYADSDENGELGEDDILLGEMTECEGGIYRMDGLRYGKYLVKEKTAPEGFVLDENVYEFEIIEDGQCRIIENEAGVGFVDQVMKGKISIFKTDKASGEKLVGAGFRVCDQEGTVVAEGKTGEDGIVTFELRYGDYTVAEYEAPEGYVLDDTPYAFSITGDGQEITVDMANTRIKGTLVISKVDADTEKLLPDAGFRIYGADGETVIKEGYTDKNGVAEFELEFGKYFYQEFDAPKGYQIDDTMYEFSVSEDGQLISVVMANQLEEKPKENTPKPETAKPAVTSNSADGPKTGDDANVRLWTGIAVSALAAVVAGVYIICRGKKRDEEDN
ncbi:SpaA isopeptide-forming pilin-related protein [Fusibacillus kribbianus]|uniref:SpaA isopeptide-forming pilin-related protein n=1 Tax=Fusibacillus kribbianus TaxID=3044208 RepID=A0AAP4BCI2_9FIRM|nr:SpaA isopeptide-forming pilin-related protein [Ruminococcus sp. YH-rum2234]MDI9243270.1 SpaA isopeptide-forming pilin-related protein [Ruminococcus sp. YH-rum2234]